MDERCRAEVGQQFWPEGVRQPNLSNQGLIGTICSSIFFLFLDARGLNRRKDFWLSSISVMPENMEAFRVDLWCPSCAVFVLDPNGINHPAQGLCGRRHLSRKLIGIHAAGGNFLF